MWDVVVRVELCSCWHVDERVTVATTSDWWSSIYEDSSVHMWVYNVDPTSYACESSLRCR